MIVSYSDTILDSVAVYSCVTGYNIIGDINESTCQDNGEWSEITAQCIKGTFYIICTIYIVLAMYCSWLQHAYQ